MVHIAFVGINLKKGSIYQLTLDQAKQIECKLLIINNLNKSKFLNKNIGLKSSKKMLVAEYRKELPLYRLK